MPICPDCGALMRPNILMFGDWEWQQDRCMEQQQRINPTEPDGPASTISLQTGALNGLQLIQAMRRAK